MVYVPYKLVVILKMKTTLILKVQNAGGSKEKWRLYCSKENSLISQYFYSTNLHKRGIERI